MALLCTHPNRSTSFLCRGPQSWMQHSGWCPQEQRYLLVTRELSGRLPVCHGPVAMPHSSAGPWGEALLSPCKGRSAQLLCRASCTFQAGGQLPRHSTCVPAPEQLQDVLLLLAVAPPQWLLLSAEVQCSRGMTSLERNPSYVSQMKSGCVLCRVLFNRH